MKKFKMLFATLLATVSMNTFAEVRYISDDVFIYLHSGPSLEYRIIGTLKVGTQVDTLKYDEKTKFMQVKSETGRVGWMKSSELQATLPAKSLLPTVQEKLVAAEEKLANIAAENAASLADKEQLFQEQIIQVDNLEQEKASLQQQILDLKARNLELDLLQETKESRIQMEWLLNGGGVLFFGLLIGLLIPFLPRRKKRTNNW
ncbi:TIGR04211 family SH3 domain-containing protein [Psychromonas sp. psych-6C06]|uniref:TIGR04211 family SH3 domain-containing protein n=1 Tax=Psychromonas sp. psych-6C06 TaxID=2058089 RepID=UPI001EE77A86|nr:TIGR04211 family SH3 domain-containing protein [Psychromonas sp. psych-6C06]